MRMKAGGYMLSEKEINFNFFDQLSILEEIEEVATEIKDEKVLKMVAK